MSFDMIDSYLDRETGEIFFITEQDRFALEHEDSEPPDWQKEHLERIKPMLDNPEPDRYINLPSYFGFHEYSVMEKFISTLSNMEIRKLLSKLIKGRGAFRRFRDGIRRFGIEQQWNNYRNSAVKQFIINWCENENIPYVDDIHK